MLKFVVFCALFAAVAADPEAKPEANPDVLLSNYGLPYATNWLSPAAVIRQDSILHGSPYLLPEPLTYSHLIKKRSAPVILPHSYIAPTTYAASVPLVTGYTSAPWISGPLAYSHLIKKRAVPLPYNYYTPSVYTAGSPYIASTYGTTYPYLGSSPLISSPYAYTQYIKK